MASRIDIRNGKFGKIITDKNGKEIEFEDYGVATLIIEKRKNLETGWYSYKLANANNLSKTAIITAEEMADKNIVTKKAYMIDCIFNPVHYNSFFESILLQERDPQRFPRKQVFEYSNPGWMIIPDTNVLVYRSNELIAKKSYTSEYIGKYLLEPAGNYNMWLAMIKNNVIGYTTLELTLLSALSAITIGLLSLEMPTSNLILSLASSTTSGKSTMLSCCTSCFAKVTDSITRVNGRLKHSTLFSWNTTDNGFIQLLSGNFGCNICIDERGCSSVSDVGKLIYSVANSAPKLRYNANTGTEIAEGFATSIISAGEVGILSDAEQKMGGMDIRLIEVTETLTQTAEQADAIKDTSVQHYGFAKNIIAKYIVEHGGIEYVKSCYEKWLDCSKYAMPHNNLSTRFSRNFVAPLMATAEIAEQSMDLKFSKISLLKYLANYCKKFNKKQNESDAFEDIVEKCKVNANKFFNSDNINKPTLEVWGRYIEKTDVLPDGRKIVGEFCIYKMHLEALLKENGYKNPTTCLKKWRDAGFIDCDSGHLTNKRTINKTSERCYVLRVFAADTMTMENTASVFDITMLPSDTTTHTIGNIIIDFSTGIITELNTGADNNIDDKADTVEKVKTNREFLLSDNENNEFDFIIDFETGEVIDVA